MSTQRPDKNVCVSAGGLSSYTSSQTFVLPQENRAVSDELAPWTSLSCPCELGRNFSAVVSGTVTHFVNLLKSRDCECLNCFTHFCEYSFSCDHHRFSCYLCVRRRLLQFIHRCCRCSFRCSTFLQHFGTCQSFFLPPHQHGGLLRGSNVSHQIQKKVPVPSAQCRQNYCVALTRDHHVRSSAPVSRSRFVVATGHILSSTVVGRTRSLHSTECQPW